MTNPPPPGDPNQWGAPPPPGPDQWGPPPVPQPPAPPKQQYLWLYVGFAVVVALLVVGGVWFGVSMLGNAEDGKRDDQAGVTEPKAEVDGGGLVLGGGEPKVDVYLDFLCPACKQFHDDNGEAITKAVEDDKATVVFHPLGFLDGVSEAEYSSRSAAAAVCAADEGRFSVYSATLFDNQPPEGGPGHDDEKLAELGNQVGLSDHFADCVKNGTYREWVAQQTEKASDISATPTIRIDGEQVEAADFAAEFADATK